MDIDAEGRVSNLEPLASIPASQFFEAGEEAVTRLKATRAGGAPGCSVAREIGS